MAKVLIAGCGDIGSRLATNLVEIGHSVTAIRRQGTVFPKGVHGITGDLLTMALNNLPDADIVFLIMTPQGRTAELYKEAYLLTAQKLVDRYQQDITCPKVLFVSSTSVYGQNSGEVLNEKEIALPKSATAKVLMQAETLLAEHLSATSVRFSGIYGPGRLRLIESIAKRELWAVNQWTNRIHRDDCVGLLTFLAGLHTKGKALERVYIGTDCSPVSQWEVKLWLAKQLNTEPNLPEELGVKGFLPVSGKRLSNASVIEAGYQFLYPSYILGYEALLEEYRERCSA
ncbi:NAD-dependent epimerase/dehydratase family protein [Marinomonas sp. 2405UD68-3]|uniref:NAD-dependent epimerase/dehydratase family protein n=1 Tax=Marinomonas sp. 2405UD68-3 TaxID=3391835 RepID=UPI0039C981D3